MTEVQIRAVAAGFLHALHTTPDLYAEWTKTPKSDYEQVGKLIKKTVGLAEQPTKVDLEALARYIDTYLKSEADAFHQAHQDAPHQVGESVFAKQDQ